MLLIIKAAHAITWQDVWLNKNQQGVRLLKQNKAQQAITTFTNPAWLGIAYYNNQQYSKAYTQFKQSTSARSLYNQGNALAYMHKYKQAIASYKKSLNIQPNNSDAKYNIELLEKLLKQQQESQTKQNDQSKQSNQSQSAQQANGANKQTQQNNNQSKQPNSTNEANKQSQTKLNKDNQAKQQENNNGANNSNTPLNQNKPKDDTSSAQTQKMAQQNQSKQGQSSINKPKLNQVKDTKLNAEQNQLDKDKYQQQQVQRVLSHIPDDPGGLLKNKFLRDYQKQQQRGSDE